MALKGIISGNTNGLRTSAVRNAVDYNDAQATSVACASLWRAQRR
ncbi:MAG: hypothetical protein E5299_01891 [Burkholderia gladioli]|nr:MAG: hypothetical protein E5299_01891 [Burkholderia gladioli]